MLKYITLLVNVKHVIGDISLEDINMSTSYYIFRPPPILSDIRNRTFSSVRLTHFDNVDLTLHLPSVETFTTDCPQKVNPTPFTPVPKRGQSSECNKIVTRDNVNDCAQTRRNSVKGACGLGSNRTSPMEICPMSRGGRVSGACVRGQKGCTELNE